MFFFTVGFSKSQSLQNCSTCSREIIKDSQIENLSIDDLRFLTNDLFARKGYVFQNSNIDSFYLEKNWYKPAKSNAEINYNSTEKENLKLFQNATLSLKADRDKMISEIKLLKQLLNSFQVAELKSHFNFVDESDHHYLSKIVVKIDIDDLHWFKNKALFNVKQDNGELYEEYSLVVIDHNVVFEYAVRGRSSLSDGNTLYPILNFSEYSFAYIFIYRNGKLKFEKMIAAG